MPMILVPALTKRGEEPDFDLSPGEYTASIWCIGDGDRVKMSSIDIMVDEDGNIWIDEPQQPPASAPEPPPEPEPVEPQPPEPPVPSEPEPPEPEPPETPPPQQKPEPKPAPEPEPKPEPPDWGLDTDTIPADAQPGYVIGRFTFGEMAGNRVKPAFERGRGSSDRDMVEINDDGLPVLVKPLRAFQKVLALRVEFRQFQDNERLVGKDVDRMIVLKVVHPEGQ